VEPREGRETVRKDAKGKRGGRGRETVGTPREQSVTGSGKEVVGKGNGYESKEGGKR